MSNDEFFAKMRAKLMCELSILYLEDVRSKLDVIYNDCICKDECSPADPGSKLYLFELILKQYIAEKRMDGWILKSIDWM